ncbi:GNAT family N-acetyltransferase [Methylobrevis pamukkalensis]|uniref:N-acetyltransferase domain-containing protein n=1 Tax=Methylobrevis pamukkalensis TaxID=1439726 RepID=A0A1E3GY53_9HYPH|nr:GNAT family N-acetyltransferase [Methylobrevis pamukkalensis]ODN68973.1 hypothetical protein A6302_03730 [Methylobrevis pamukkalensis]
MTEAATDRTAIRVVPLTGADIRAALDALADLRIAVFRAFPYLYDGTRDYERDYLIEFAASDGAVLVAALDGDRIVGVSTASPMAGQKPAFRQPFAEAGFDVDRLFYFGESVLLPGHRGLGIGHAFFDHREARARAAGATHATFCAVVRAVDHPLRPEGYRPLDAFWGKRGYRPQPGLTTTFSWKDVDEAGETAKTMQFWMRDLRSGD